MTTTVEWKPRMSVDLSPDLYKRWQEQIPWGLRSQVVTTLLEETLDWIAVGGPEVIALIIQRKITAQDLLRKKGEQNGS